MTLVSGRYAEGAVSISSSTQIDRHPLNTVAPYFTMFPPAFPLSVLAGADGWVLDPFCGRGTSLFAGRVLGLPSVGIDSSPVATAIAAAKLADATPERIVRLAEQLKAECRDAHVPTGAFWDLAYERHTLADVCAIRSGLASAADNPEATALRAVMLGALHGPKGKHTQSYFSNQMPRTYATKPAGAVRYWERRDLKPDYVDVIEVVRRRANRAYSGAPTPVQGQAILGDSRDLVLPEDAGPIERVVTSPPYYGMRTYLTDQWLRQWFVGGPEAPSYSSDRQIDMSSVGAFSADLARVWRGVAAVAEPGCRMTIRFGAIPSAPSSPEEIIRGSIEQAHAGWVVDTVADAGAPTSGRRQAQQFGFVRSTPIQEVDVSVALRG